jgi:glycosyltransferase involved in cell wall biosynthesis
MVFDNCSADNTTDIVSGFVNRGHDIKYYRNRENIGADRNIATCFLNATGKYVWVFSDDDFLLPGYLKPIFNLLDSRDYGAVYLNGIWYTGDYNAAPVTVKHLNYEEFGSPLVYLQRVNFWATFITGNIVNKSLFADCSYISEFYDSNLVQLSWILPAMFKGKPNLVVNDKVLACKEENTGGYKLMQVFGKNLNEVLDKLETKKMVDSSAKRIINIYMLHTFFPMHIDKGGESFSRENRFFILLPVFWKYPSFWLKVVPMLLKIKKRKLAV